MTQEEYDELKAAAARLEGRKCETERETWTCPNMRHKEGDLDMEYEHYECKICGRTMKLDYEEMR